MLIAILVFVVLIFMAIATMNSHLSDIKKLMEQQLKVQLGDTRGSS